MGCLQIQTPLMAPPSGLAQATNALKHWLCFYNLSLIKVSKSFLLYYSSQERKERKEKKKKLKQNKTLKKKHITLCLQTRIHRFLERKENVFFSVFLIFFFSFFGSSVSINSQLH